jgi:hypothetical protein
MPKYNFSFVCRECTAKHPLASGVELTDGPSELDRAVEFYRGKEMPQIITDIVSRPFTCPMTSRQVVVLVTSVFFVLEPDGA